MGASVSSAAAAEAPATARARSSHDGLLAEVLLAEASLAGGVYRWASRQLCCARCAAAATVGLRLAKAALVLGWAVCLPCMHPGWRSMEADV